MYFNYKIVYLYVLFWLYVSLIHVSSVSVRGCPIAAEGSYYIQNYNEHLCITADNITTNIKGSLREMGNLSMKTCDYGPKQEWGFINAAAAQNKNNCTFHISSSMIQKFYLHNGELNVNLTGNFVDYWSSPVQIIENTNMKDNASGKCFQSINIPYAPTLENCNTNHSKQFWMFLLVNDPSHLNEQINSN